MTLKIVAILITTVVGLIQIALEYKWHDKLTAIHKRIRVVLISLMIVGFSTAAVLIYLGDRDARDRLATLIDLKSSAEKSADDEERREKRAKSSPRSTANTAEPRRIKISNGTIYIVSYRKVPKS